MIQSLPSSVISSYEKFSNWRLPSSVDINCPFCDKAVSFSVEHHFWQTEERSDETISVMGRASCPRCKKRISLFVINPSHMSDRDLTLPQCFAVYPAPSVERKPIEGLEAIPETLQRSYLHTIQAFNAKVWPATATQCGRTLEGFVKHLTGEKGMLHDLLRKLPEKVDLAKPIIDLADSVREGRNIGAHFDPDIEPDEQMAKALLNLLEYLLEYFCILPKMIENARNILERATAPKTPGEAVS